MTNERMLELLCLKEVLNNNLEEDRNSDGECYLPGKYDTTSYSIEAIENRILDLNKELLESYKSPN